MMDSVHSDWRPQRHVCYTENLAASLDCLRLELQFLFFNFIFF